MEKATIKDLIARKMQKDNDKIKFFEIPVKSLGKSLMFRKPTDEMRLDMLDDLGNSPDIRKTMEVYKKIIYLSCELLQSRDLHEELGIKDPFDTVDEIFDLDDILDIGDKLMDAMELNVEEIKNS